MTPRKPPQSDELGELLELLSNPHRRRILTLLNASNPRDEVELAFEELAGDDENYDVTLNLSHNHLPRLADLGFISWDREQHVVTRGPRFHEISPVIELLEANQDELPADWF